MQLMSNRWRLKRLRTYCSPQSRRQRQQSTSLGDHHCHRRHQHHPIIFTHISSTPLSSLLSACVQLFADRWHLTKYVPTTVYRACVLLLAVKRASISSAPLGESPPIISHFFTMFIFVSETLGVILQHYARENKSRKKPEKQDYVWTCLWEIWCFLLLSYISGSGPKLLKNFPFTIMFCNGAFAHNGVDAPGLQQTCSTIKFTCAPYCTIDLGLLRKIADL